MRRMWIGVGISALWLGVVAAGGLIFFGLISMTDYLSRDNYYPMPIKTPTPQTPVFNVPLSEKTLKGGTLVYDKCFGGMVPEWRYEIVYRANMNRAEIEQQRDIADKAWSKSIDLFLDLPNSRINADERRAWEEWRKLEDTKP